MVCSPKEARLKQAYSLRYIQLLLLILAAGQVGPDHLLLTLIDPRFDLLKKLDSNKPTEKKFLLLLLQFLLASGQVSPDYLL